MKYKVFSIGSIALFLITLTLGSDWLHAQAALKNLRVEYQKEPLGIDIKKPRFSWQMKTDTEKHGQYQTAYRIKLKDEADKLTWDTDKVVDDSSLGIVYEGEDLKAMTRYIWELTVWDEQGSSSSSTSWFETGLFDGNPDSLHWNGAQWIGGGQEDMVFYSHYLSVFKMDYTVRLDASTESTKASFVFGGNDTRLMDRNKNIQGVEARRNKSFIRFEIDVSDLHNSTTGLAKFNVYRVGYAPGDSNEVPFRSFEIPADFLDYSNKYDPHTFYVTCNFGFFEVYMDGQEAKDKISPDDDKMPPPRGKIGFNLNPVGRGNDYISFPMLADIGFYTDKNHKAEFSKIHVRNFRTPSNLLFSDEISEEETYHGVFKDEVNKDGHFTITDSGYSISGAENGTLILVDPSKNGTPMLRTEFNAENKKLSKARLYVTARGIYEIYLNGKRVGSDYFTPGLTQYNKTHMYQTYDVTELVDPGNKNALGAWLSEGWWSGNITFSGENWNYFGDRQSLLAQMVITFEDGTRQIVTTDDENWKLNSDGPIRYGSFFQGEVYDAAKENGIKGWTTADYDDDDWKKTVEVPLEGTTFQTKDFSYDDLRLIGQIGQNPTIVKSLEPISVEEVRPGVYVYDMGQNMVGFPEVKLPPGKAGDTINLRYAEVKYPNLNEYQNNVGMVMLENIRAALAQDRYIRKGGEETIKPRFTFHGYRYLEVTGVEAPIPIENVKGHVISSIRELASNYETSNNLVNKLWENITWSLRGNFLSIPTDTPARNERMGWSGDINVFSRASTYLADVGPFLNRHLLAMRDIQREDGRFTDVAPVGGGFGGTLWGSAGVIVAWEVYQQYGDLALLREHYDAMVRYVEFLNTKIDPDTGVLYEGPLGDWLSPEAYKNEDTEFWAAYHIRTLEILSKTASLLGKTEDAANFEKQYHNRKLFFNKTYIDPTTGKTLHLGNPALRFGPPIPEEKQKKKGDFVDTQASYAIPLAFDVLDEVNRPRTVENLVFSIKRQNEDELGAMRPEYSLMTGFIGTASLNHALSENGKNEIAYRLLQQTSYPSWLYSVKNGATTIWERLNSFTVENGFGGNNSMNSFNHYSFGAVAAWMYNYSLGIQRDAENAGFKHFILRPTPDPDKNMKFAKGYYDSMYGRIKSEWRWEDSGWNYKTTVPANTKATLYLKTDSAKNIIINGVKVRKAEGVKTISQKTDEVVLDLASGTYDFVIK